MNIARSTFYYRHKTAHLGKDTDVIDRIEAICLEFPGYGYRRVTEQLKHDELVINHKKVLRLMRESDLLCRARRKRVKTTKEEQPAEQPPTEPQAPVETTSELVEEHPAEPTEKKSAKKKAKGGKKGAHQKDAAAG